MCVCDAIANGIRVLANTVRGLSQKHIRILYKTCVVPVLTYASPVWYRSDRSQIGLINKLDKVQNISLRHISGAFKTTPIDTIRVLSHQPPIRLTLQKLSSSAAVRLLKIPLRSMVAQRLPDVWRKDVPGLTPFPTLPVLPHNTGTSKHLSCIEHLSSLSHPKGERVFPFSERNQPGIEPITEHPRFFTHITPCSAEDRQSYAQDINRIHSEGKESRHLFYCDGSLNKEGAGAAVIFYPESCSTPTGIGTGCHGWGRCKYGKTDHIPARGQKSIRIRHGNVRPCHCCLPSLRFGIRVYDI